MKTYLLTGIPRSGTTLACKILNELENTIALHEPLNPSSFYSKTSEDAASEAIRKIQDIEDNLVNGVPFEHGNKGALLIDNPVSTHRSEKLRKVVAQRGLITLPPQDESSFLIVKQNAFFAATIHNLKSIYPIVAIVRNPVDVLMSWRTVDLPVNRGHIPAGEKYDAQLKSFLQTEAVIARRQAYIYSWFIKQYISANIPIVSYESIIASHGVTLTNAFGLSHSTPTPLGNISRYYSERELADLSKDIKNSIVQLSSRFYSASDIYNRLEALIALNKGRK